MKKNNLAVLDATAVLTYLLCALLIMATFSGAFVESIIFYEFCFISVYWLIEKQNFFIRLYADIKAAKLTALLMAGWFIAVIASYLLSPYNLYENSNTINRMSETFMHVAMFIVLRDYLLQYRPDLKLIAGVIYLSVAGLALAFFFSLYDTDIPFSSASWATSPIFNSNIRTTGTIVTAAVALSSIFIINYRDSDRLYWPYAINIILWTFMFWMGGRGSIVSIWIMILITTAVLKYMRVPVARFLTHILIFNITGIFLSELFAVFYWNGLFSTFDRSVSANSINQLSSSRLVIWESVFESLKGHYSTGLGPYSCAMMPNNTFAVIHPHNSLVQFLCEWGVLGAVSYVALLVTAFAKGIQLHLAKKYRETYLNDDSTAFLASGSVIVAMTLHSLTDANYFYPQPSLFLVVAYAIWTTSGYKFRHEK